MLCDLFGHIDSRVGSLCSFGWWEGLFGDELLFLLELIEHPLLGHVPVVLLLVCEVLIQEEQVHIQLVLDLPEQLLVAV